MDRKRRFTSGNETPAVDTSMESLSTNGMFDDQFSDLSDYEHPHSVDTTPVHPPYYRTREMVRFDKPESETKSDLNSPLLDIKCDKKHNGYLSISGNNEEHKEFNGSYISSSDSFEPFKIKKERQKHNSIVTIFAVWNTIMGSSLLTMAWGIERAGLIPSIMMMTMMGGICLFTSYILLRVCFHHGNDSECEVSDLCRMLLGRWAEVIAKIFSLIVMFGANIIYLILMTNFLFHTVNYFKDMTLNSTQNSTSNGGVLCPGNINLTITEIENGTSSWGGRYWDLYSTVPVYVAIMIFPLLNFKSATFFTKFNSLGTLSVLYLILFVIIKGAGWGLHIESWISEIIFKTDFTVLSGMLALSFYIHNIIITIMRSNKHQEKNGRDLSIAFILVIVTYMVVGAIFYMCFPLAKICIEDNILNNFAKNDALTAVARLLLLFQVVTVYPLIAYMLRIQIIGPPGSKIYTQTSGRVVVMVFNIIMVTVCVLFACFVPKIGTIIRYTGALSGLVHVFTLPSLLQITSLYRRGKLTLLKIIFYVAIFLIGACNLLSQFFVGD